MAGKAGHRGFGYLRRLRSGRVQASYVGPDTVRYVAPQTFDTREDAEAWLVDERRRISAGTWLPPGRREAAPLTLREYAPAWLANRHTRKGTPLRPRTREHYDDLLDRSILPTFGDLPLPAITPEAVDHWWAKLPESTPTQNAHAYALLSAVMESARKSRTIPVSVNPCQIDGARVVDRKVRIEVATLDELVKIHDAMPERLRLAVLLAAWCGVRFGELFELRRGDVRLKLDGDGDPVSGVLRITRGVVRAEGQVIVDKPKTSAGNRDVAIPPHLLPAVVAHLKDHVEPAATSLLFPAEHGGNLAPSTLYTHWYRARAAAGRDDLRWHDLRHVAAVYAAQAGATMAELMGRLGHSSSAAALRYQHVARDRDAAIAAALSKMATGGGAK